ncbi:DUF1626 domain-containing protein [Leptolyngbya sp. PCC 6406]|uniref:DUF1626 domain-containing protein n=1 Tax=Leptolyngbya sp. PCC 6406 TaxID=1173264 RepID=UPI0002AC7D9A|nr:DUF1626 domain-containing protein [Leptolyngbya sp. PCC 6406]
MATTTDDIWRILNELAISQKELSDSQKELSDSQKELSDAQKELSDAQKETDRQFHLQVEENDRKFRLQVEENDRKFRLQVEENDRRMKQLQQELGKLGNRLGEFVEWQVRPAVLRLFQQRGIEVHEILPEVSIQRGDAGFEIDLLVVNTTEAILVEVKSKLSQGDVDEHLERLAKFKQLMPRYSDVQAMGAVAGMVVPQEVARYAYRKGLFVLAQSGETVEILNDDRFQPRTW